MKVYICVTKRATIPLAPCTSNVVFSHTIIEILGCRVKKFRVVFSSAEWLGTEFREFASILVPRNGIPSCAASAEGFGTELWEFAAIFDPRNGIPSYFLFRGRVRIGIPRFSVTRNNRNSVGNNHLFRLFLLPRNYFFSRKFPTLVPGEPLPTQGE